MAATAVTAATAAVDLDIGGLSKTLEDIMQRIAHLSLITLGIGALLFATTGLAQVQEESPKAPGKPAHTQAQKGSGAGNVKGQRTQIEPGTANRLGPLNGKTSRGVKPQTGAGPGAQSQSCDGTASQARNGARKGQETQGGKATKNRKQTSRSQGSNNGTLTRTRKRTLNAPGSGSRRGSCSARGSVRGGRR
jgi:hypothetical protein